MRILYIGCYTGDQGDGEGIVAVRADGGELSTVGAAVPADSPSFLAWHPTLPVLYAVTETPDGAVAAWSDEGGGELNPIGDAHPTGGADPCHLTIDPSGRYLIATNYSGGNVAVHALGGDGAVTGRTDLVRHELPADPGGAGPGRDPDRQEAAHPHMSAWAGDVLLVSDLGADRVYRYRLDGSGRLAPAGEPVPLAPGTGPRHLASTRGTWYVSGELDSSVTAFETGADPGGHWRQTAHVSSVRSTVDGSVAYPSELGVGLGGRFLYVANRGPDTIAVFALDGPPRYVTEVSSGGAWPRHLAIDGEFLYVANQRGHTVTAFRLDAATGVPEPVAALSVSSPACVLLPG